MYDTSLQMHQPPHQHTSKNVGEENLGNMGKVM